MSREWYFVCRLRTADRPRADAEFEVQVLDDDGLAVAWGCLAATSETLTVGGRPVPAAVISAAKQRAIGQGEYVGPDGKPVRPF